MSLPVLLQVVSTIAIVTGSTCAILAYLRGARTHKESINAQVYLNLTKRHADLVDFRRLDADGKLLSHWDGDLAIAAVIREYFDLLSHELALVDLGILDERVWALWQPDITRIVNTPLVSDVWRARTRHLHNASPVFRAYVERLISQQGGEFSDGHTGTSIGPRSASSLRTKAGSWCSTSKPAKHAESSQTTHRLSLSRSTSSSAATPG